MNMEDFKMDTDFREFYNTLKENLDSYNGEYASFIDYGPELFKLSCDILKDDKIGKDLRLEISAAIAYYVVPLDVIPETIYGPYGYIDDIYITVHVLKKIEEKFGYELLDKYWDFEEELKYILEETLTKCEEITENKQIDEIFKYIGLAE